MLREVPRAQILHGANIFGSKASSSSVVDYYCSSGRPTGPRCEGVSPPHFALAFIRHGRQDVIATGPQLGHIYRSTPEKRADHAGRAARARAGHRRPNNSWSGSCSQAGTKDTEQAVRSCREAKKTPAATGAQIGHRNRKGKAEPNDGVKHTRKRYFSLVRWRITPPHTPSM